MKLPVGTYTFYNNFENCPYKAYRVYVVKDIPRVETPEMKWGNDVHSGLEHRIKDGAPLPEKMVMCEPVAAQLAALQHEYGGLVEGKLAIDAHGWPVGFWDDHVWFRGKLDCAVFSAQLAAWIVDWKTGKPREEPFELETGALLLKAHNPKLEVIVGEYFWLQTGKQGMRYTLTNFAQTYGKLQTLRNEMEGYAASGVWPKRKNPLCGWCDVLDCEYNKKGKRK